MRGRKLLTFAQIIYLIFVEIYPREGTETLLWMTLSPTFRPVEIYPREGTETRLYKATCPASKCWNLSPWGDGNCVFTSSGYGLYVEIYPREGTETCFTAWSSMERRSLKFIPVRGRKPLIKLFNRQPVKMLKFIPVRGRKPRRLAGILKYALLKFIPERGRKLCYRNIHNICSSLKFIPERGRKHVRVNKGLEQTSWNLSSWGDGNSRRPLK